MSEAMLNKKVNNDVWNKANNEVNNKFDVLATMFLRYVWVENVPLVNLLIYSLGPRRNIKASG